MPTSVLLAVLAAAGLLALAPALVRRYDTTERQVAEREWSTARVLSRPRRRRTVPRGRPVNPPRRDAAPSTAVPDAAGSPRRAARHGPARRDLARRRRRRAFRRLRRAPLARLLRGGLRGRPPADLTDEQRRRWWRYHRRRVLVVLLAVLVVQLGLGAGLAPAFFVGAGATVLLTCAYLAHLRNRALADARRRREAARRYAEEEIREARARALRRRRAAALAAARRATLEREFAEARERALAAERELADGTYGAPFLRGRPYQARAVNL